MATLKITQKKSRIGATERQRRNLDALGLHKMNRSVFHEDSPIIMGMVEKVRHLVAIEAVEEGKPAKKAAPKAVKEKAPKAEKAAEKKADAPKEEKPAVKKAATPKAEKPATAKPAVEKAPAKPKTEKKEAAE